MKHKVCPCDLSAALATLCRSGKIDLLKQWWSWSGVVELEWSDGVSIGYYHSCSPRKYAPDLPNDI